MSLIFNIFPNYVCGYFVTNASDKIAVIPQLPCPKLFPQVGKLLEYLTGGDALHHLNNLRRRISRRDFNKYVNMVCHNFHRIYPEPILFGYLSEYVFYVTRYFFIKYLLHVLRYPHQVIFQIIYGMLCPSYSHAAVILKSNHLLQVPLPRLSASHFHPASKLAGIQLGFL